VASSACKLLVLRVLLVLGIPIQLYAHPIYIYTVYVRYGMPGVELVLEVEDDIEPITAVHFLENQVLSDST